ncbi:MULTISPECIES: MobF family relaxase [Pseudomonas chlororaphis group]|uniref:MobF family relaxase n=1 Tax=Pseudomonas chlororaphis group TaxID=136842 RepID=UPI002096BB47|nr:MULTISPECIES: MobF family relaxase [Pseudomonas chlororaphis group]MCO7577810.1 relaxase domain-containing protein [Pseudomonas protegens]MCO7584185.1 relaxase domain-containing protein [Pseudomonas chlororaphis]MCO7601193.1 relaxase domain-containing protein [Pseudomonas chlororaphis]
MAIFTIDKFSAADIAARAEYFERGEGQVRGDANEPRSGGEDYYHAPGAGTLVAEFAGSAGAMLVLGIKPENGDYAALMSGVNPRTGESFVSERRQGELLRGTGLAGYSTSFNADKTISLLYASLPREQQVIVERAMMEATRNVFDFAERQGYVGYRTGAGGCERHNGKMVAATYLHFTNRNLEPHLHVHAEIPNACLGADGQWRPLDGAELFRRQTEYAALFDTYLARAIERDLPQVAKHLEVDLGRNGLRVAGISRETVLEFSTRRIEILQALEEMGASGADSARGAAKRTREGKKEKDSDELRAEWREQLANLQQDLQRGDLTPETRLFAEQLVFRNASVFGENALDRAAAQLSILHGGEQAIPAIRAALVQQLGVIELPQEEGRPREFTTETYRQLEAELLAYAHAAQKSVARFALPDGRVAMAIEQFEWEKGFSMRDEQRAAVMHCAGGSRFQILQGAAGTGKSASLTALRLAYESSGNRVIGLAPSGAAAAELENSAGLQSRTIHSLLMRLENDNPKYREKLSPNDVIVCDEGGLADLRTLNKLASYVDAAGAKLILVGDGRQLEAVGSASSLDMLTVEIGCAELVEIARQRDPTDRAISQAWFEGPAELGGSDALDMMANRGLLRSPGKEGPQKAIDLMMRDALQARAEGTDWSEILLLADRNQSVRALNTKVREHRFAAGELDQTQQVRVPVENGRGEYGDLDLAHGDRIMLRRNKKLDGEPVYNGDRATLIGIERVETGRDDNDEPIYDTKLTARLDRTGNEVSWLLSDYASVDYAYAMTVHKSQGLTVDRSFYLVSESTDRRLAYVAFTRARQACPFYLENDQQLFDALARNTAAFRSKRCALDADKQTRELIAANARAGLHSEQPFCAQQPSTKDLLEKAGERFQYPGQPQAEAKQAPEIHVMPASQAERDLAAARGFAIGGLIDKPDDTRLKPGKPYDLPSGTDRIGLLAEPLPPAPTQQQTREVKQKKEKMSAMPKPRKLWTKAEQQRETQAIRERIDLREHAERLGYVQISGSCAKVRLENKALEKSDPMREITLRTNARGEPSWIAVKGGQGSGLGGDVFHLHQHATGQTFLDTRDELRKIAFNHDFQAGAEYQAATTAERTAKAEQSRQQEVWQSELRRAAAYKKYQQTTEQPNGFLASRGISQETLAESKWRTDHHGNAVFPHVRGDGKFTGYERKKDGPPLYSKSERGVYVANPNTARPTEICVAEGGLDALSLYQLSPPEKRVGTLFASSAGNPAEDTARAIIGLARRYQVTKIALAYDRDPAGDGHTETLKRLFAEHAPHLQIGDVRNDLDLRSGEDPNDLLKRRLQAQVQHQNQPIVHIAQSNPEQSEQIEQATAQQSQPEQDQEAETYSRGRVM